METHNAFIDRRRHESFRLGIAHREAMIAEVMRRQGLVRRPFVKDIIDYVLEDIQEAMVREDVLRLDTYGQTELVGERIEVTVNSRIAEMPHVKDVDGIKRVLKWHESLHIARDLSAMRATTPPAQLPLPGLEAQPERRVLCRKVGLDQGSDLGREFTAENGAKAAAIASVDLARCPAYRELRFLAVNRGDLDRQGPRLIQEAAEVIGVNRTALRTYLEHRGLFYSVLRSGRPQLQGNPQFSWSETIETQ